MTTHPIYILGVYMIFIFTFYRYSYNIFIYGNIFNHGQVREIKKEISQIGVHLCARKSHEIDSALSFSLSLSLSLTFTNSIHFIFSFLKYKRITLTLILSLSLSVNHSLTVIIVNSVRAICVRRCF